MIIDDETISEIVSNLNSMSESLQQMINRVADLGRKDPGDGDVKLSLIEEVTRLNVGMENLHERLDAVVVSQPDEAAPYLH